MSFLLKLKSKFVVYPSFIILLIAAVIFGYIEEFIILLFVVLLHELSHVFVAVCMRLKIENITFMPMGLFAVIKDMDFLPSLNRICIIAVGPFINILIWLVFSLAFKGEYLFFTKCNLMIGLFNLLPIFPLDGGRLLQIIFGNIVGVLTINKLILKFSKVVSVFLIILGFFQIVLYSLNISLLCIGVYIYKINANEHLQLTYDFYKVLLYKTNNQRNIISIKNILVNKNTKIQNIVYKFSFDKFYVLNIVDNDKITKTITEKEIMDYILDKGLYGTLEKIIS